MIIFPFFVFSIYHIYYSVLKFDELKNLEMYFCPNDSEDDVAEGLMNVYWKADEILCDNFFAQYFVVFYLHYIMSCFQMMAIEKFQIRYIGNR